MFNSTKAHLVFYWWLYNKLWYVTLRVQEVFFLSYFLIVCGAKVQAISLSCFAGVPSLGKRIMETTNLQNFWAYKSQWLSIPSTATLILQKSDSVTLKTSCWAKSQIIIIITILLCFLIFPFFVLRSLTITSLASYTLGTGFTAPSALATAGSSTL